MTRVTKSRSLAIGMLVGLSACAAAAPTVQQEPTPGVSASAPSPSAAADPLLAGAFTQAQVERGRTVYGDACGGCHGSQLRGGHGSPPVSGVDFLGHWTGKSVFDLYEYVRTQMPLGQIGRIDSNAKLDSVAYILSSNGYPVGGTELSADPEVLQQLVIKPPAPDGRQATLPEPAQQTVSSPPAPQAPAARRAPAMSQVKDYKPVTKDVLVNPAPENWMTYLGKYESWSYSPLKAIDKQNVNKLQLVWSRTLDPGAVMGTPQVYNGVMFFAHANDIIQAIDAATGSLIWEYRRELPSREKLNSITESKRSVALWEDKVIFVSWDNFIVALDAKTGKLAWETDRGRGIEGKSNSSGPLVANGVVVAGSSCQFSPFGCETTGHDASTGKELWRMEFIPRKGQKGDETWGGSPYENRWCTGSWGPITYDPKLDLVYFGSSAVCPSSEAQRGMVGATLAGTNTRYAVRPKTGEVVWKRQVLPRDGWDQDCVFETMVVESPINPKVTAEGMMAVGKVSGQTRKVVTGVPCKLGIAWTLDAATGEFLWAKGTTAQNIVSKIDQAGKVTINEENVLIEPGKTYKICPTEMGGRGVPTSAYSPIHNAIYVPLNNMCADTTPRTTKPTPADSYNVDEVYKLAPGKTNFGRIDAVSVETGETLWSFEMPTLLYAPVTATGGDLLLAGGLDRYFRALDSGTGKVLWQTRLPGQVSGKPVSYSVNGRQYIAVAAGGSLYGNWLATLDRSSIDRDRATGSNGLFVFALPEH